MCVVDNFSAKKTPYYENGIPRISNFEKYGCLAQGKKHIAYRNCKARGYALTTLRIKGSRTGSTQSWTLRKLITSSITLQISDTQLESK